MPSTLNDKLLDLVLLPVDQKQAFIEQHDDLWKQMTFPEIRKLVEYADPKTIWQVLTRIDLSGLSDGQIQDLAEGDANDKSHLMSKFPVICQLLEDFPQHTRQAFIGNVKHWVFAMVLGLGENRAVDPETPNHPFMHLLSVAPHTPEIEAELGKAWADACIYDDEYGVCETHSMLWTAEKLVQWGVSPDALLVGVLKNGTNYEYSDQQLLLVNTVLDLGAGADKEQIEPLLAQSETDIITAITQSAAWRRRELLKVVAPVIQPPASKAPKL